MTDPTQDLPAADPIRVGLVGLGRSGWNIHAQTFRRLSDLYTVVAASDPLEARRQEAQQSFNCRTYDAAEALLEDPRVELVVVASPNHLHTRHAIAAMNAGKHVVAEKPFALCVEDADRAVEAAQRTGRILAPFQNRRYEPHYCKVREVIASGVLGEVVLVRMTWRQFNRRWDWQTLRKFGGGVLNNNGSHLIDHAVQLFAEDAPIEVFADLRRVLSVGDAEDHVKVVLKAPGQPTVDIELTGPCAYPQDRWLVTGSAGGLRGSTTHLEWKTIDWSKLPVRQVEPSAAPGRQYNQEDLPWQQFSWDAPKDLDKGHEHRLFYRDLYETVRRGRPLTITPASVRRLIDVFDRCHASYSPSEGTIAQP